MQQAAANPCRAEDTAPTVPVTVVIPAYGDCPHLPELVSRIFQGTRQPVEVIVSHSSVPDPSAFLSEADPRVRVLHQDERLWAGSARNRGARLATTEWIAFVDSDVMPACQWLETLFQQVSIDDRTFAVGSVGYASPGGYWGLCNWACEFSEQFPWLATRTQHGGASCNMIVSSSDFRAAGGFPTNLKCGEDTALFYRLRELGRRQVFASSARVDHHNLSGLARYMNHQYELGYHSAVVRQYFPLKGQLATRHAALALLLWVPRLMLVSYRLAAGGPAWWLRGIGLMPGILLGTWSWTAGFLKRVTGPRP